MRFVEKMQVNIPIFGVQKPNLREFTTTEKDMKRGQSKYPPAQFRLKEEDIVRESETQMVKAEVIDSTWTFMEDYKQNVAIRNQQFQESKDFESKTEDDEEEDNYEVTP